MRGPWKRHLTFRLSRPGRGRRDHGQEVRMFGSVWFCLQRAWNPSIDGRGAPALTGREPRHLRAQNDSNLGKNSALQREGGEGQHPV